MCIRDRASSGVEVVTSTIDNKTTIYFAPDSSGTSGSITFDGIVDADLSSITLNILSGSVDSSGSDLSSGSNIELGTDDLTAQSSAENFVFDASYASSTLSGSDGPLTITGFDQANDKLVILASDMPVGYDLNDFKIATGIDIVASTIDNNTTIYFAPDADGNSTSITLAGIVDGDLAATSIEFTSSLTGETSSGTVTSTDTSASADATSDATDTSTADSTDTTTDDSTGGNCKTSCSCTFSGCNAKFTFCSLIVPRKFSCDQPENVGVIADSYFPGMSVGCNGKVIDSSSTISFIFKVFFKPSTPVLELNG